MGLKYTNFFDNSEYESDDTEIIICKECSSHLCLSSLIISDSFLGSSGPALLVDKLINYVCADEIEETQMKTGTYLIRKVKCHQCLTTFGWTYKKSFTYRESYKEGKFVIENAYIKSIENNSYTETLIELAKQNYRRRLSSNSTISSSEIDDEFKFNDSNLKYLNHLRLQNVKTNDNGNSNNVLVEL